MDDRERLEQWFREAFVAMQQVACRTVAKVWIKKIHPKKVSSPLMMASANAETGAAIDPSVQWRSAPG
jgi:hypothetical protein